MSSSDLYVDGFPHGTPEGYDRDCRGGACPAGVAYGLSCRVAKQKSRGDFQYRKLVKDGASIPEIAQALGLIGSETLPAPAKKPTTKANPAPTAAKAKGAMSVADTFKASAAASDKLREDAISSASAVAESPAPDEPEQAAPSEASEPEERVQGNTPEAIAKAESVPAAPAPKPGEIRTWARSKGYEVGAKGKLPQHIVDHYWEATGRLSTAPAEAEPDTNQPELDTSAPAVVTTAAPEDDEPAAEITDAFVEISIDVPDLEPLPRPEWGAVAESVDVEAARGLAVRLEQELAHTTELLAAERNSGSDLARDYLNELGKTIAQEERIADLRERLEREKKLRVTAERAATLALSKWGTERADNEAAHALILGQAHTINQLTEALAGPRWILGADVDATNLDASRGRIMHVPETHYYFSSTDTPDGTIDPAGTMHPRPNTTDGLPDVDPAYGRALTDALQSGATVVERRPWWRR